MTRFSFDIVGFDLDGTLFDTSGDLAAATNHALALAGRPALDVGDVTQLVGRGAKALMIDALDRTGGCDDELVKRLYPELLRYYEANIARETRPYPGLFAAMDALDAAGATLAIVTNKFEYLAVKLVAELGLSHRFATVIGGDTMGPGNAKPSPAPIHEMIARCGGGRAAFVGDSRFDIGAARAAGIPSVAVSFGFPGEGVAELGADAVIDHYDQLVPALAAMG